MSTTTSHCRSMYLQPSRPNVGRKRSASMPIGLASMNAQEAGIIFSAAERATARRRRIVSIHAPAHDEPCVSTPSSPPRTPDTIKASPPRPTTSLRRPLQEVNRSNSNALRTLEFDFEASNTEDIIDAFPGTPISPNKRQVENVSLKNYADGLFQFTQTRLVTTIPTLRIASPPATPRCVSKRSDLTMSRTSSHTQRPSIESKFSDWSIMTGDDASVAPTPAAEEDFALMTPDSFFGDWEGGSRHRKTLSRPLAPPRFASAASSDTYDPPSDLPPATPPSRCEPQLPQQEEFSYFTNYQHYINASEADNGEHSTSEPPENLAINLSPLEHTASQSPWDYNQRNSLYSPLLMGSCSGTPGPVISSYSVHSSPFAIAEGGVHVPRLVV